MAQGCGPAACDQMPALEQPLVQSQGVLFIWTQHVGSKKAGSRTSALIKMQNAGRSEIREGCTPKFRGTALSCLHSKVRGHNDKAFGLWPTLYILAYITKELCVFKILSDTAGLKFWIIVDACHIKENIRSYWFGKNGLYWRWIFSLSESLWCHIPIEILLLWKAIF